MSVADKSLKREKVAETYVYPNRLFTMYRVEDPETGLRNFHIWKRKSPPIPQRFVNNGEEAKFIELSAPYDIETCWDADSACAAYLKAVNSVL